jgi:hypothetical protein
VVVGEATKVVVVGVIKLVVDVVNVDDGGSDAHNGPLYFLIAFSNFW